ncbi:uncharacterized protein LOC134808878 [Pan troglodytes]|uniref:uncharacterized protein LOC134808878 n=1 Tax=Pan troglodytes TaxID=9598 RepID=UPI003013F4CA
MIRACSSEASLERRGDRRKRSLLCLSPSPAAVDAASGEGRPFSRGLPGHGLGQHRAGLLCPQPAPEYPDTDLPGGTGHGIRRSWMGPTAGCRSSTMCSPSSSSWFTLCSWLSSSCCLKSGGESGEKRR